MFTVQIRDNNSVTVHIRDSNIKDNNLLPDAKLCNYSIFIIFQKFTLIAEYTAMHFATEAYNAISDNNSIRNITFKGEGLREVKVQLHEHTIPTKHPILRRLP